MDTVEPYWWWVIVGSGNGLEPLGNKPLPEPILTQIYVAIWRWVNSSPPSAIYMRQLTGSRLVQVMACRLFSAKPFPEPMMSRSLQWCNNERDGVSNHQPQILYSTINSGTDHRKHQSSASLAFVRGIHRSPVNSPHKWPVTRKMLPFDDIIMDELRYHSVGCYNIESPSETHLILKSRNFLFVHNTHFSCQISLKFCTEHGGITVILYAKLQNNLETEK